MPSFLDKNTEPVRRYLYGVVAALVAALTAYGVVDGELAGLLLALATAVLAVPAVEAARARVTPVPKARTTPPAQRGPAPGVYGPDAGLVPSRVLVVALAAIGALVLLAWLVAQL